MKTLKIKDYSKHCLKCHAPLIDEDDKECEIFNYTKYNIPQVKIVCPGCGKIHLAEVRQMITHICINFGPEEPK